MPNSLQQFHQRDDGSGAQRGPHGQTPTASRDGFQPHWCRGTLESSTLQPGLLRHGHRTAKARERHVRAHHTLTFSCVKRRSSALADALRPATNFATGGWAWVYNSAYTTRQGVKENTDAKVLKAKLALN